MKFKKTKLCTLPCCYAVSSITVEERLKYLFATDDVGACCSVDAETLEVETVWEEPGGTMSIVPLPQGKNGFLASQRFLPGFSARHARIVRVSRAHGRWQVAPWLELPYVHRFALLERGGHTYFLGCILTATDAEQADWSSPGFLVAAELDEDFSPPAALTTIATGMTYNHGYWQVECGGHSEAYTACKEGIFHVAPPSRPGEEWLVERILNVFASDIALCDIDGDGLDELAVIEPFHGNSFSIYHQSPGGWHKIYSYPQATAFLHAIWGGRLCGEPVFVAGCREINKELFVVRHTPEGLRAEVIESGQGPSNVAVLNSGGASLLLTANRESGEGALFTVQKDKNKCAMPRPN